MNSEHFASKTIQEEIQAKSILFGPSIKPTNSDAARG